jgi:hypothetical protein
MNPHDRPTAAGPRLLARTAAAVATGCAVLHLVHGATGVLRAAVALACLPCAVHLWLRPGRGAWGMHVALCLAMALHPVLAAAIPAAGHLHAHGPATGGTAAAALLAGLGLLLAAWRWWLGRDLAVPWETRHHPRGSLTAGAGRRAWPGTARARTGRDQRRPPR